MWNFEQREEKLKRRAYILQNRIFDDKQRYLENLHFYENQTSNNREKYRIERITVIEPDRRIDGTKIEI